MTAVDAPWSDIARYAMSFNAYQRRYGDLGTLSTMLEPLQQDLEASGVIPDLAGADSLRAWLFVLVRSARFSGGLVAGEGGSFTVTDPPENSAVRKNIAALNKLEEPATDRQ